MTSIEVIDGLARRRVVERLVSSITHRSNASMQDLSQIVYMALLNSPAERIMSLHEQGEEAMNCYIAAIIRNQFYSDSSRFWYENRRYVVMYENSQDTDD